MRQVSDGPQNLKNRTCVLTLQADRPGGVPTVIDWWHKFLIHWGHQATTLYAPFEPHIAKFNIWQRLRHTAKTWRVHVRSDHPNPTWASSPPPFPLWLFYFMPQWIWGNVLNHFDQVVVAGGPCLMALPLALRRQPFILWIGTLYEDELRGKSLSGDTWARNVLQSPFWPFLRWQERFVLRHATRILAQSPYTLRRILEEIPEVSDRIHLVMVPVDTELFHPPLIEKWASAPRMLLTVGRINDTRKNIPILIEAFSKIRSEYPDVKLVLAGEKPGASLIEQCKSLNLEEHVLFKGVVTTSELSELYRHADLFVLPSTQEGLGIVLLESMASGTPIVATNCGGSEEIVLPGYTGQIVENNNSSALAAAVVDLLKDSSRLQSMQKNSVSFIQSRCTPEIVEHKIYHHFVSVFPDSHAAQRS